VRGCGRRPITGVGVQGAPGPVSASLQGRNARDGWGEMAERAQVRGFGSGARCVVGCRRPRSFASVIAEDLDAGKRVGADPSRARTFPRN
jgi:hypothetical protein